MRLYQQCFVTVLSLSGNQLQDSSMTVLADALAHNGCLRELNLSYNSITVFGSTLLATALQHNTHLHLLDLMHNHIGRDGIHPWLGRTLRTNRTLQQLKLSHNNMGDKKAHELLSSLAPPITTEEDNLKSQIARRRTAMPSAIPNNLKFRAKKGEGGGFQTISENPTGELQDEPFNSSLTTLLMSDTGIADEAAHQLAHVLTKNRSLTHLDVSSNNFTNLGNGNIAHGLEQNRSLRLINYSDNTVSEVAATQLIRSLCKHTTIETALFQACFQGTSVASTIADWTRSTKSLKTLDLVLRFSDFLKLAALHSTDLDLFLLSCRAIALWNRQALWNFIKRWLTTAASGSWTW